MSTSIVITLAAAPLGDLSEPDARELTDSIRRTGELMWRQIVRAYRGRAWVALGYDTWDAYCDAEFDGARIRLPREKRHTVVGSLREAGMSTRAIAAATGTSLGTVHADLTTGVQDRTSDDGEAAVPARVIGLDGKTYTPPKQPNAGRRRRRINPQRVVATTVAKLAAIKDGLDLITDAQLAGLDLDERLVWVDELRESTAAIRRLQRALRYGIDDPGR